MSLPIASIAEAEIVVAILRERLVEIEARANREYALATRMFWVARRAAPYLKRLINHHDNTCDSIECSHQVELHFARQFLAELDEPREDAFIRRPA